MRKRGEKIPENRQSHRLAFFRMKLHSRNLAPSRTRRKSLSIRGLRGGHGRICRIRKKGMHEINMGRLRKPAPEGLRAIANRQLVPTNLRDLQSRGSETLHSAPKESETPDSRGLFAGFKEHLISHADSQKRTIRGQPIGERIPKTARLQTVNAIAKCPHPREHDRGRLREARGIANQFEISTLPLEGVGHTPNVSAPVIDERDHLVAGTTKKARRGGFTSWGDLVGKRALSTRNATDSGINLTGLIDRFRKALKDRLRHVMSVPTIKNFRVEIDASVNRKSPEKFLDEGKRKRRADGRHARRRPVIEEGATTEIDDDPSKGFIHGQIGVPIATNPPFIAERFGKCLAESDPRIFDRVVEIHLDIAISLDAQIAKAMAGKKGEHVIEEGNLRVDRTRPLAIDQEIKNDLRLGGLTINFRVAHHTEI